MNRTSWEFTYSGSVLAEVTKKRIEEIEEHIKSCNASIEATEDKEWRRAYYDQMLQLQAKQYEYHKWIFVFEKHPDNKHDLDRDDFVYFFQQQ